MPNICTSYIYIVIYLFIYMYIYFGKCQHFCVLLVIIDLKAHVLAFTRTDNISAYITHTNEQLTTVSRDKSVGWSTFNALSYTIIQSTILLQSLFVSVCVYCTYLKHMSCHSIFIFNSINQFDIKIAVLLVLWYSGTFIDGAFLN